MKAKEKIRLTLCCNAELVFNNKTGDHVCSICRKPAKARIFLIKKPKATE